MFHDFDSDLPEDDRDFADFTDEELDAMEDEQDFEDDGQPDLQQEYADLYGGDEYYDHSEQNSQFFDGDWE